MNPSTNNQDKLPDFFLDLNIEIVDYKDKTGKLTGHGIQLRKNYGFNENNFEFLKKLIEISLKDEYIIITMPVKIKFNDKIKAIAKLRQAGLKIEKKE